MHKIRKLDKKHERWTGWMLRLIKNNLDVYSTSFPYNFYPFSQIGYYDTGLKKIFCLPSKNRSSFPNQSDQNQSECDVEVKPECSNCN